MNIWTKNGWRTLVGDKAKQAKNAGASLKLQTYVPAKVGGIMMNPEFIRRCINGEGIEDWQRVILRDAVKEAEDMLHIQRVHKDLWNVICHGGTWTPTQSLKRAIKCVVNEVYPGCSYTPVARGIMAYVSEEANREV